MCLSLLFLTGSLWPALTSVTEDSVLISLLFPVEVHSRASYQLKKPFIRSETETNWFVEWKRIGVIPTRGSNFWAPNIWLLANSQFQSMCKLCYWVHLEPWQSRRASIRLRSWYDSWDPFHHWDNHDYFRDFLQGGFDVGEQQKNTEPGNAVWASAFINKRPEQPCLQRPYFDPGGNFFLPILRVVDTPWHYSKSDVQGPEYQTNLRT